MKSIFQSNSRSRRHRQIQSQESQREQPFFQHDSVQKMEEKREEPVQAMLMQRQAEKEEELVQKMEEKKEEPVQALDDDREEPVQAKSESGPQAIDFQTKLRARRGQGNALPEDLRKKMEKRIQADFSRVRIHTDAEAAQMSQSVHAQAFTNGMDIYFNEGKYSPDSLEGQHLLAHELTHVVQQNQEVRSHEAPADGSPASNGE